MEVMAQLILFVLIVIVYFIIKGIYKRMTNNTIKKLTKNRRDKTIDTMPMITHICADKVKKIDPNFSEEKMLAWARGLFVKFQKAWTSRNWEQMRLYETKSLYEQHKNQVQEYINTNRINIRNNVTIEYAYLYKFRQEADRDILEIALKATMKDYIIDATTKQVLEGSKTKNKTTIYKMTFERKTGVLTPKNDEEIKTTNCLNCGAPTQIISVGKCDYCGSVITTEKNTWALISLGPMKN